MYRIQKKKLQIDKTYFKYSVMMRVSKFTDTNKQNKKTKRSGLYFRKNKHKPDKRAIARGQ